MNKEEDIEACEQAIKINTEDRLLLHQLRLLEWMDAKYSNEEGGSDECVPAESVLPDKWHLTKGVTLYPWQTECIRSWFRNNTRGTVKVVTGGGKTILALAIIERLQNKKLSDLRVAIIVPTIVLMNQWYEELIKHSNLSAGFIARHGGGYKDDFSGDHRILICVLASAYKELPKIVKEAKIGNKLFLIADECHRFGAKKMLRVFETERAFSLGLSATPERDENENEDENILDNDSFGYEDTPLGKELGKVIYDFTLSHALKLGIIPQFTINHYGLDLNYEERVRYDRLSKFIKDKRNELQEQAPKGCSFFAWVMKKAKGNEGRLKEVASRFLSECSDRKELLYKMNSRKIAVEELIDKELTDNPDARIVLFHERIKGVMDLFIRLKSNNFPVVAEHGELPDSMRETGLELFREGIARIIVSARSLIEGFNVPEIDVGIIVASSSSSRQRIQSLGRVLRKHRTPTGEEKTSCIHILYAHNTKDEDIYSKEDWDKITGIDCNNYFLWDPPNAPQPQDAPPKKPLPEDINVDPSRLKPDCVYPGKYDGEEFKYDTNENISNSSGQFVKNPGSIIENIQKVRKGSGSFKVTPQCNYVLVLFHDGEEWITKFVCKLKNQFEYRITDPEESISDGDVKEWIKNAALGEEYKFQSVPIEYSVRCKIRMGNIIITKKIRGGVVFARTEENAEDQLMGKDADSLAGWIKKLKKQGVSVSKFEINKKGHVLYRQRGSFHFVYALIKGLEFPD